uniref:Nucleocapsid n=1 Tax=Mus rat paramyxovirus TaxID=3141895 RepID=A0AAU7E4K8_9MONO
MSRLNSALAEFREFKNKPSVKGSLTTSLGGVKKKVVILVPTTRDPIKRWRITVFLLKLVWSLRSSGSMVTGAFISLLTIFAESPSQMIRSLSNDPDLEAQIAEIKDAIDDRPSIASRGQKLDDEESLYQRIAQAGPEGDGKSFPFESGDEDDVVVTNTEQFQMAIASVTLQIWVLLIKAVTAPDNAPDSENRRWRKFMQQRRAIKEYQLSSTWLNLARDFMAYDLCIRRFMVEILLEIRRTSGVKSRIVQMIDDVGYYIQESGMAGFFLTIKYGIETRYPTLALNEFQSDLNTILDLMKAYKEFGERAPFMVILEDAAQAKFAPGNYTLLWSYAMGVGSALDSAMSQLNFTRNFLMMNYFRLGQDTVIKMEGNLDHATATELGVTQDQVVSVRKLLSQEGTTKSTGTAPNKSFVVSDVLMGEEEEEEAAALREEIELGNLEEDRSKYRPARRAQSTRPKIKPPPPPARPSKTEAKEEFTNRVGAILGKIGIEPSKFEKLIADTPRSKGAQPQYTPPTSTKSDIEVMNES